MADTAEQVCKRAAEAGKTYAFDERHDERRPAQMWFQESDEGLILFGEGDQALVEILEQFNRTQDYSLLETAPP